MLEWRDRNTQPERLIRDSDAVNGGRDFAINNTCIINLHEEMERGYDNASTVCAQGILAAKHKGKSGSSTQETPHVLVEKQKKQRHSCYSAHNSHISARWMTLLFSMM